MEVSVTTLLFRDSVTPGDHRVTMFGNATMDIGATQFGNTSDRTIITPGAWVIREESGVLVFRINGTAPRYAFFPGTTMDFGCSNQVSGLSTRLGVVTLYTGVRWVIREADGVLEFRDTVANTRYAFQPGCGNINPSRSVHSIPAGKRLRMGISGTYQIVRLQSVD